MVVRNKNQDKCMKGALSCIKENMYYIPYEDEHFGLIREILLSSLEGENSYLGKRVMPSGFTRDIYEFSYRSKINNRLDIVRRCAMISNEFKKLAWIFATLKDFFDTKGDYLEDGKMVGRNLFPILVSCVQILKCHMNNPKVVDKFFPLDEMFKEFISDFDMNKTPLSKDLSNLYELFLRVYRGGKMRRGKIPYPQVVVPSLFDDGWLSGCKSHDTMIACLDLVKSKISKRIGIREVKKEKETRKERNQELPLVLPPSEYDEYDKYEEGEDDESRYY